MGSIQYNIINYTIHVCKPSLFECERNKIGCWGKIIHIKNENRTTIKYLRLLRSFDVLGNTRRKMRRMVVIF